MKHAEYIQPALEIGKEDDEHEKEANVVADKVMRMSDGTKEEEEKGKLRDSGPKMQKMVQPKEDEERKKMVQPKEDEEKKKMVDTPSRIQKMVDSPGLMPKMVDLPKISKKTTGANDGMTASKNVEQGINSSKGSGQSLSPETQQEMGSKMGADFSGVKVHTDESAVQMNREVGAKAFTHGNDIYFNQGQYNPETSQGKHLLAHELTHTVQQGGSIRKRIQKAESDTRVNTANLKDAKTIINKHVNNIINKARSSNRGNLAGMISEIYENLGADETPARSKIEYYIDGLDSTYKYLPKENETKYAGSSGVMQPWDEGKLWAVWPAILNPSIKVDGILIGSDKLGHFFQQGHEYYEAIRDGQSAPSVEKELGWDTEAGGYGLSTTGVFSNADLVSNKEGMGFYNDFAKNPDMTFDISKYINSQWNEQSNPNFYSQKMATVVWPNLISKSSKAEIVDVTNDTEQWISAIANLKSSTNNITGKLSYINSEHEKLEVVVSGTIAYKKDITGLDAVTSIQVILNWKCKNKTGQMFLESSKENLLYGSVYEGSGKTKLLGGINIHL